MSGEGEVSSSGSSSSSLHSSRIIEKFHIGGVIKSTQPIVYHSPQNTTERSQMPNGHPRILNRSLTGPTLDSPPSNPTSLVNRRSILLRNTRTTPSHRSSSAHPTVSTSRPKFGPIRVLSLAHSIPENADNNTTDTSPKKRSRSASSIEACRPESPRRLLAFMFSGAPAFANDSEWSCANTVHRILNLTGIPCTASAYCKCTNGKHHHKEELVLKVNGSTSPKEMVDLFIIVNRFISRARSAASNVLVCHQSDHIGYCIAFIVQYIIVHHDIQLLRAISHCQALQNIELPPNAMEALRIWEVQKDATPEPKALPLRSDDFKWVQMPSVNVCAPFGSGGLLIYEGGKIELQLGWQYNDEESSWSRNIHLEPVPSIPSEAEILDISGSESGHYISIIANCGVFVLVVPKELWQNYGFYNTVNVIERLRDHYYVKCHSIHPLVYSGENAIPVVKHRWLSVDDTKHIIAILSEDNTVRLFELGHYEEKNTKVPVLIIDFRNMASSADHFFADQKERKTFGLHKAATSFDFGPVITDSLSDIKLHSIFVADTEGDIFYAAVSINDYMCIGPVGPMQVHVPKGSGSLLGCDITDIKYISHWYSEILSIFAVASSGRVYHLVVNQVVDNFDEDEFSSGSMLSAHVRDVFQFDNSYGMIVFSQDNVFESKYLVQAERSVGLMDISAMVFDLCQVGCGKSRSSERLETPSLLHLAVLPDGDTTNCFASLSCIKLLDSNEKHQENRFLMLARTKGNKLVTKLIREFTESAATDEIPHGVEGDHGETENPFPTSLRIPEEVINFRRFTLPVIHLGDAPKDQQIATIKCLSVALTDACNSFSDVLEPFRNCAQRMAVEFLTLQEMEDKSYAKMVAVFNELVEFKTRFLAVCNRIDKMK
ncbi:hypothetical protein QR680_001413 [Steinernema hermaphroditum]|uniref:Uncharacterized protein n=1 Tax=Steinernema hermaphroditum TaxID=289476 RepID=A0AA39GY69_9BILA|nr:hypothetical protein QR680_001413 [Steinernema hermaphroditum]